MTLIYDLDLYILKMYLPTKCGLSRSKLSKPRALQTDTTEKHYCATFAGDKMPEAWILCCITTTARSILSRYAINNAHATDRQCPHTLVCFLSLPPTLLSTGRMDAWFLLLRNVEPVGCVIERAIVGAMPTFALLKQAFYCSRFVHSVIIVLKVHT